VSIDGVSYVRACVQGERTGWESVFLVSLTGSGSYGGSLGGVKANAMELDIMELPTRKTKNNKPKKDYKRVKQNHEQQSYRRKFYN